MKKTISALLAIIMAISATFCFGTATAFANNYSSGEAIQEALNRNKTDSSTPLTVTVTGTYYLSQRLVIYSNTTLDCTGATLIKNYNNSTLLAIGQNQDAPTGNNYYKNITIKGGVFDGNKTEGSIFSFAHAQNVTITGSTFKDCKNGHHLTFAGCDNVSVTGCTFSGHYRENSSESADNMEALQLDILESSHFPNYKDYPAAYDGTMNTNITITGNTFTDVNRGVGAHSVFRGRYMQNINISNNTFTDVAGYAVLASSFLNVKINNNTITNCGAGIYYKTVNPDDANTYKFNNSNGTTTVDTSSEIKNNTISIAYIKDDSLAQAPYGVRVYGESGDEAAQNLTISGNNITISRRAIGIWLKGAKNNTISSNTVTFKKTSESGSFEAFGIRLESSPSNTISSNTITANNCSYVNSGIIVGSSKSVKITSNKVSGAKLHGINISSSSSATITKNTVSGNGENGIYCYNKSTITTNSNTVKSNKKHGIFISSCSGKIKLNKDKVQSNSKNGISLQKASNVTITSAKVSKNKVYGIYLTQSSKATISKCTVSSSSKEGIYVTQKSTAKISSGTVSSNKGCGIYFTNKGKGSVKSTKVQKNKKTGIYITKKAGKVTVSKVKYSGNKGGKIKK